jgi:hypothetical protein
MPAEFNKLITCHSLQDTADGMNPGSVLHSADLCVVSAELADNENIVLITIYECTNTLLPVSDPFHT